MGRERGPLHSSDTVRGVEGGGQEDAGADSLREPKLGVEGDHPGCFSVKGGTGKVTRLSEMM